MSVNHKFGIRGAKTRASVFALGRVKLVKESSEPVLRDRLAAVLDVDPPSSPPPSSPPPPVPESVDPSPSLDTSC